VMLVSASGEKWKSSGNTFCSLAWPAGILLSVAWILFLAYEAGRLLL